MSAEQAAIDYSIHPEDRKKVARVLHLVTNFMLLHVGQWVTPREVRLGIGADVETEITARLRDMRKPEHGAWGIECQRIDGAWRYRLSPHKSKVVQEEETAMVLVAKESAFPAIPGEITETSLVLPQGLPYEEWERIGKTLQRVEKSVRWWIGDWLAYGERAYGEKYAQAIEETGQSYKTLANSAYVSSAIEFSRRRENLSWSHHAEVAALEPAEQDRWLDKAAREDWSKADLREQLALTRTKSTETSIPVCRKCGIQCRVCLGDAKLEKKKARQR